jgi:hypothetical protein
MLMLMTDAGLVPLVALLWMALPVPALPATVVAHV